ncbi:MAG: acyltransferase [Anaerovoracaceae bacterium]|jgi:surface polysaccharide O-acyltransferase-like enzyme
MYTSKSVRDIGIDFLKTIAIIGVIIIHTCSEGYQNPILSFNWLSSVFWGSIMRASVPVFFMCSGALLLNPKKELTISRLYKKNLLKIVLSMFIWALGYKVYHLIVAGKHSLHDILFAFKEVILFNQEFHLYFLQILVVVYVFLPVTRIITKHATKKELKYALAVWFLLGIVYPTIKPFWPFTSLTGIPVQWMINMTYAAIGYGLLGYYLSKNYISLKRSILFLMIGFLGVYGGTIFMSVRTETLYQNFLEGMSVGVALLATGLFCLCYNLKSKIGEKATIVITKLSKASFCIYLVHVFWIYFFGFLGISVNGFINLLLIPLISFLNLALSYCTFLLLNKIPLIRNWLI